MAPTFYTFLAASSLLTAAFAAPSSWRGNNDHSEWRGNEYNDQSNRHYDGSGSGSGCDTGFDVSSQISQKYTSNQVQRLKPQMPTLDGLASNSNVTLFAPVLGIGNQNYTCNGTSFVQSEADSGAVAQLYDLTDLLLSNQTDVNTIAQSFKEGSVQNNLPQMGLHYFSEDNVPVFNLTEASEPAVLACAKIAAVDAPDAESNVPWLFLLDAENGVSQKLNTVYRIDTDKGVQDDLTCSEEGQVVERSYAAQYWFYY